MLFIDEMKAGCPRQILIKALQAEGVHVSPGFFEDQNRYPLLRRSEVVGPSGRDSEGPFRHQAGEHEFGTPSLFREPAPELIDQYVKGLEKVWAHRKELAQG
jgi:hypothetical protein